MSPSESSGSAGSIPASIASGIPSASESDCRKSAIPSPLESVGESKSEPASTVSGMLSPSESVSR